MSVPGKEWMVEWLDPGGGQERFAKCDTDEAYARKLAEVKGAAGMERVKLSSRETGSASWTAETR